MRARHPTMRWGTRSRLGNRAIRHPGHPNNRGSVRTRASELVKRPYERGHRQRSTAFELTKYGHQPGKDSLPCHEPHQGGTRLPHRCDQPMSVASNLDSERPHPSPHLVIDRERQRESACARRTHARESTLATVRTERVYVAGAGLRVLPPGSCAMGDAGRSRQLGRPLASMGFVNCDETHQPIAQWEVIRANHTINTSRATRTT